VLVVLQLYVCVGEVHRFFRTGRDGQMSASGLRVYGSSDLA
jgi:hypothetical protein